VLAVWEVGAEVEELERREQRRGDPAQHQVAYARVAQSHQPV
jgi:hypothetical protein